MESEIWLQIYSNGKYKKLCDITLKQNLKTSDDYILGIIWIKNTVELRAISKKIKINEQKVNNIICEKSS